MTRIPHMAAIQKTILANFMAHLDDIPAQHCVLGEPTHPGAQRDTGQKTEFYGIGAGRDSRGRLSPYRKPGRTNASVPTRAIRRLLSGHRSELWGRLLRRGIRG